MEQVQQGFSKAKAKLLTELRDGKTTLTPSSSPQANPNCEICRGDGFVTYDRPVGHHEFGKAFPCRCMNPVLPIEQRRAWSVLRMRRDTDAYIQQEVEEMARTTFGSFYERSEITRIEQDSLLKAVTSAQMLATGEAKYAFLTMRGQPGNGKTHIAKAALNHLLASGGRGMYVNCARLMRALREGFEDNSYNETLKLLESTPFLVLDDYLANKDTEWTREQLYMLVDERYTHRLRTIITTNKPDEDMEERVRDRITSWHNGVVKVVTITAPSYRTSGAAA